MKTERFHRLSAMVQLIKPKNLNQALGLLLCYVIVPLLLGALALLVLQTRHEKQLMQTQLTALAKTLVQTVDRELDHGKALMDALAASSVIDRQDWQELHAYGREISKDRAGSIIVLIGPQGDLLVHTGVPWGAQLPNIWSLAEKPDVEWQGRKLPLSTKNLTRQVFEQNNTLYSDLFIGAVSKRPSLALSVPVVRGGKVVYALLLSYPTTMIERVLREAVNAPGLRAVVIDRRSVVVASNEAAYSRLGDTSPDVPMTAGDPSGTFEVTSRDGTALQGAYAVSSVNGFTVRVALPSIDLGGALSARSTGWLLLVLGVLGVSVVLAGALAGLLERALRELGDAAASGATTLPTPSGIAEIDLLARALQTAAQAEQRQRDELVLSVKRQQTELELRKADRQKDEFLATLAHELRNPLAPIRTAVELIRQRQPADAVVQRARDVIERQVSHLSRLVDDLLEMSRITTGTIRLHPEVLDLGSLVASVVQATEATAAAAGLRLTQDLGDAPVMVNGDATRLSQCVMNLVNNAMKFTPPGGSIGLRVAPEGGLAVVEVSDDGIGISAENLDRIFDLFMQANPSGNDGHTGLGIGLALTRKLVALHDGVVLAASDGKGRGSLFRIELPLITGPVNLCAPKQALQEPAGSNARVLVVDDNQDAADMLGEMLRLCDFQASVEYTGEAALRAVESGPPDAMLLDIGLPDLNGYQVCRRIRAMPGLTQPVIIALTGWGQDSDREQAQAAGFDAHLTKPVDPDTVMALLAEKVAARKAGERLATD